MARVVLGRSVLAVSSVACAIAFGCSSAKDDGPPPLAVEEGCQPLLARTTIDETSRAPCLLPYPSDFHRAADPTMLTGHRVRFAGAAVPRKQTGELTDPHTVVPAD